MPLGKKSLQLFLLSTLSGVLLWLSWPERGFTPLIFVALIPVLFVNHHFSETNTRRSNWKAFGHFYWCMLTWNSLTTWWIYNSTDVGSFAALSLNSLFLTLVWMLFHATKKKTGPVLGYASLF